uniref:Uncharacterized protein n=1 Tax=Oryza sativa subsp. japonica TaxID=39947 RepID=Q2QXR5_ORYSJ|nr:hypothetical protein LOC_Os12g05130 [Oryza sativa Japonica Group]
MRAFFSNVATILIIFARVSLLAFYLHAAARCLIRCLARWRDSGEWAQPQPPRPASDDDANTDRSGRSARRSESRWSAGGPRWSVPSACQSWRTAACSRHAGTASTAPTWTEPRRGSKEEVRRVHEEKEGQELRHCQNSSRHWSWEMAPSPSSFAAASRPSVGVGKLTGSGWKTQRSGTVPISPNSSGTQLIS